MNTFSVLTQKKFKYGDILYSSYLRLREECEAKSVEKKDICGLQKLLQSSWQQDFVLIWPLSKQITKAKGS